MVSMMNYIMLWRICQEFKKKKRNLVDSKIIFLLDSIVFFSIQ